MIELITTGNGTPGYPGNFTKKEIQIINEEIKGYSLHLFSGRSSIGDIRIDYACKEATFNIDVFKYLEEKIIENDSEIDTIIIDAPYNKRFADKYNKFNNIDKDQFIIFAQSQKTTNFFNLVREINPKRIIMKSWNYYVPHGYKLTRLVLCYPGGYRKTTFLEVLDRVEKNGK